MKLPDWWLRKTSPASVDRNRSPCVCATSPIVSGTVESHRSPMMAEKIRTLASVSGSRMKAVMTTARAR